MIDKQSRAAAIPRKPKSGAGARAGASDFDRALAQYAAKNRVVADLIVQAREKASENPKFNLASYIQGLANIEYDEHLRKCLLAMKHELKRN